MNAQNSKRCTDAYLLGFKKRTVFKYTVLEKYLKYLKNLYNNCEKLLISHYNKADVWTKLHYNIGIMLFTALNYFYKVSL